jgi:hypothetical protein
VRPETMVRCLCVTKYLRTTGVVFELGEAIGGEGELGLTALLLGVQVRQTLAACYGRAVD